MPVDSPWCTEMAVVLDYRWLVIVVAVTEMDTRKMRVLLVHLLLRALVEILRSDIWAQFLLWVLFAEKKKRLRYQISMKWISPGHNSI